MKGSPRRWLVLLLPLACGSSSSETAVTGTVEGMPFTNPKALALSGPLLGASEPALGVLIASEAGGTGPLGTNPLCADFANGFGIPGTRFLEFAFLQYDDLGMPIEPTAGDFSIGLTEDGPQRRNARCALATFFDSRSTSDKQPGFGTIHISKMELAPGGSVQGTFDVTFGADHVEGSFNAPTCAHAAPDAGSASDASVAQPH